MSKIKERVEEKEGIPPAQQRLIYGGKQMYVSHLLIRAPCLSVSLVHNAVWTKANTSLCRSDDKTAADYQLEGGATLHLVLALRGGF